MTMQFSPSRRISAKITAIKMLMYDAFFKTERSKVEYGKQQCV